MDKSAAVITRLQKYLFPLHFSKFCSNMLQMNALINHAKMRYIKKKTVSCLHNFVIWILFDSQGMFRQIKKMAAGNRMTMVAILMSSCCELVLTGIIHLVQFAARCDELNTTELLESVRRLALLRVYREVFWRSSSLNNI